MGKCHANRYREQVGVHVFGGHCTKRYYELLNHSSRRSCSDNFENALREFAIKLEDLHRSGVFDVFMSETIDEHGTTRIVPPLAKQGDFVDLLAEMDVLVDFSNCPDDVAPCNGYECKDMMVQALK